MLIPVDADFFAPARGCRRAERARGRQGSCARLRHLARRGCAARRRQTLLVAHPRNLNGLELPANARLAPAGLPFTGLRDAYAEAGCVVLPQRGDDYAYGSEGGGLTALLEAMAMGRPVVATDRAILHDYVDDGVDALLVPPEDPVALRAAIERVLGDPELAQSLGAAARARVERSYTSPEFAARLAPLLQSVVYPRPSMSTYTDVVRYRELLGNLFRRDLQAKYRGSVLGVLWTVANPIMLMGVYLLVFGVVWPAKFSTDRPLSALPPQRPRRLDLLRGRGAVFDALDARQREPDPEDPLPAPARAALSRVRASRQLRVHAGAAARRELHRASACTRDGVARDPARRFSFVGLVCGIALAFASLNVLFRDIEFIVAALLVPLFFLTPILYPLTGEQLAKHHHVVDVIHWANPLSPAIEAVRAPLFGGTLPHWTDALYLGVSCFVALALGALVFTRVDDQIAIEV